MYVNSNNLSTLGRRALTALVPSAGLILSACSGGSPGGGTTAGTTIPGASTSAAAEQSARSTEAFSVMPAPSSLSLEAGFKAQIIANVASPRELTVARNGDLLMGTEGRSVVIVTNADAAGAPGSAKTFLTLPEGPAAGITLGPNNTLYVGTEHAVWKVHYAPGDQVGTNLQQIAALRTGSIAPNSDGDIHRSTSVAVLGNAVFAGVGSSCNACTEVDPGRAAILRMGLNGESPSVYAKNVRNAIAMAVNPRTVFLWAGGAGQDNLPAGHPYEYFDAITQHPAGTSWGWPKCEERNVAYTQGANCAGAIVPHVELPAYSTIIGATFYPLNPRGPYAFPAAYRGGLFLTAHGSWHKDSRGFAVVGPQVDFVPMSSGGWDAQTAVNWGNPKAQFRPFFSGFQVPGQVQFNGRPAGVGYGPNGSLFVTDDQTGNVYRIRPG